MLELNLILVGLVVGLLVAMTMLGSPRVIVPPVERYGGSDGGGGGCGVAVIFFLVLVAFVVLAGGAEVRFP